MINNLIDRLSGLSQTLNRRERYLVLAAFIVITVFAVTRLIILPFTGQTASLQQDLSAKKADYQEMIQVGRDYLAVARKVDGERLDRSGRDNDFTLFSFLDRLAGETGVKQNISYMRPSTANAQSGEHQLSQVEMKLDAVSMENLISFLFRIEMSQNAVVIKRLSIARQDKDEGGVDAVIQVETFTD